MTGVIYGLKDPRTPWRIRYVGGTRNLRKRRQTHMSGYRGGPCSKPLRAWFNELREANILPEFETLETVSSERLHLREKQWIALMNSFFPLLNLLNRKSKPSALVV